MDKIITTWRQRLGLDLPQRFDAWLILYISQQLSRQKNISGLLSWQTLFLIALVSIFCVVFTLTPAKYAKADVTYSANPVAELPIGNTRVVADSNDEGDIVGTVKGSDDLGPGGTLWDDGEEKKIEEPVAVGANNRNGSGADSDYSSAFGINDNNQIVGSANIDTGMRAFRSQGTAGERIFLDPLPGDTSSAGLAINRAGKATGWSSGEPGIRPVTWSPKGKVRELPMLPDSKSCRGLAINNAGVVAGVCDTTSGPRAVQWIVSDNRAQELDMLPGHNGNEAISMNARGDIVGISIDAENQPRAVLWPNEGVITDLGALLNQTSSKALAINNPRTVTGVSVGPDGERAFVWTKDEGMLDLNDLMPRGSSVKFVFTHGLSIASNGNIIVLAHDEIEYRDGGHTHEIHDMPLQIFSLNPIKAP